MGNGKSQLFIEQLKDAGLIKKAMFSLDLRLEEDTSSIYFGGWEQSKIQAGTEIEWVNLVTRSGWGVRFTGIKYGSHFSQVVRD